MRKCIRKKHDGGAPMTIGEKIFQYRKQAGLSQEDLAYKLNVTRQSVSLWETDQTTPSLESLMLLAEIFSVSMDDLCGTSVKDAEPAGSSTLAKEAEPARPSAPEKSEYLACVQTRYTAEFLHHIGKVNAGKYYRFILIALIFSIIAIFSIIFSDIDNGSVSIPILFVVLLTVWMIRIRLSLKKQTTELLTLHPNCVVNIKLFQDRLDMEISSDNSDSKSTIQYRDVKKVINDEKCILIYYGNTFIPIEKNLPDVNYDLILKLLNAPSDNAPDSNTGKPQNGKIKTLLLVLFVLSLFSIFMALSAVASAIARSPLPDFPYTMPEYMWIFFLFLPLPLTSAVLGIVFFNKKYPCKKNIVAGFIMCVFLSLFGSFSFFFKNYSTHDFGYVRELEQIISVDLPDSGYISRTDHPDGTTNSLAMIKFDDANEIYSLVSSDRRFSPDTSKIPSNLIDLFYASYTTDYDYFMLIDVTGNNGQLQEHRYVFLAYHVEKNILFVLDFVK